MSLDLPYFKRGKPIVRPSFCLFADLLGFSSKILGCKSSLSSNRLLRKLDKVVVDQKEQWRYSSIEWQYKLFSDCVVFAHPIEDAYAMGEPEFGDCIREITCYQLALLAAGFVLRGAITIGEMHLSDDLCFGKALVEAVDLEKKCAVNPRVILSEDARSLIDTHLAWYGNPASSPHALELRRDLDDRYFINYLEAANYTGDGPDWNILLNHRKLIATNLKRHRGDKYVRAKYEWLRDYHDYFCTSDRIFWTEEWGGPPDGADSLLVDKNCDKYTAKRFSQIVEGNSRIMSSKFRSPLGAR